jgi:pyruvate-ferredoxin/flavodoxin oxidoreductase
VAKFAASGKKTSKKDMGLMMMSYGYIYVATVAMGANRQQLIKALLEAEQYDGPSLIMAYSPCINHGIFKGMGKSQAETKLAVASGYWPLYRYNPGLKAEGKNPFILDSKAPDGSFKEFLAGEIRYASLKKSFPQEAAVLNARLEHEVIERFAKLKRLAEGEAEAGAVEPEIQAASAAEAAETDPTCTLTGTAEHSRADSADEACDDGRAGT